MSEISIDRDNEIERCIVDTVQAWVDERFDIMDLREINDRLGDINRQVRHGANLEEVDSLQFMHQVTSGALKQLKSRSLRDRARVRASTKQQYKPYEYALGRQ